MSNKKKFLIFGGIILVIVVLGILCFMIFGKESDASRFKREYESLNGVVREKDKKTTRSISIDKDNPFIYQGAQDIIKRIKDKETFAVYFGFADCPWCRSVVPYLASVSKEMNVGTIYYVDVKEIRDVKEVNDDGEVVVSNPGKDGYDELVEMLSSVLSDYSIKDKDGKDVVAGKRIYAPNLVVVNEGVAVSMKTGISSLETDAFMDLTEEMINETKSQFREALSKLNSDGGVCTENTGC